MASFSSWIFAVTVVLIGLAAGYVYVMGIPPEMKRKMEEKALETMGENKASYAMKDAIGKVPTANQEAVDELRNDLADTAGRSLQNPLGKLAGETADDTTRPISGR